MLNETCQPPSNLKNNTDEPKAVDPEVAAYNFIVGTMGQ
jgi:hypothetical protein